MYMVYVYGIGTCVWYIVCVVPLYMSIVYVHAFEEQRSTMSALFHNHSLHYFLRLKLELAISARLVSQQAPETCLSMFGSQVQVAMPGLLKLKCLPQLPAVVGCPLCMLGIKRHVFCKSGVCS